MHITDDLDRPVDNYNPILDNEIDIDAPYIDWDFVQNSEDITIPKNGVYDTLYYLDTPILVVDKVSEIEIRFYTTTNPNENYRIGQRHIKGRVQDIARVNNEETSNDGFTMKFDASRIWNGKISTVTVDREYVNITKTRCIAILYFDEEGEITNELVIPIEDWFSPKVYLNTAFNPGNPEEYPFKVNDLVDCTVYLREETFDYEDGVSITKFNVYTKDYTGRIADIELVKREYKTYNENGIEQNNVIYYHLITLDISEEYDFEQIIIASTVIEKMTIHKLPPEEI